MRKTEKLTGGSGPALLVQMPGEAGVSRFEHSFRVGRASENDLVVDDPAVSQEHLEVVLQSGRWWLRDLNSTNGTLLAGRRVQSAPITAPVRVRLGQAGPALILSPEGTARDQRPTETLVQTDSAIVDRYFSKRAPEDMSQHTANFRRVFMNVHRRTLRKYVVAVAVLAVLGAALSGYAYFQQRQIARQRAAAAELFYAAKAMELEVAQLELSAAERQSYRERRQELDQRYADFLEELGIYSDKTPAEVQLVYRVAHRFGESEANIPKEFVDEVLRYVDRWKQTNRLQSALARDSVANYADRIASIMLDNDMPPDFFYLALQESELNLEAIGPETRFGIAKGMWQFMPATAREYGLKIGPLVGIARHDPLDERHDFEKATQAAARYLRRIYTTDAQASGLLVVASYNWGQSNVLRLIRTLPPNPRQRNFWQLLSQYRDRVPRETYGYVFSIVSAAVIGENPELFGFDFDPPLERPAAAPAAEPAL